MKTNTKQSIVALILAGAMAIPFAFAANEPENVNNVSAVSKDATTLTVSWDAAKDYQDNAVDHYRIYYGTQSVQGGDAPSYEVEVDTPDNAATYDLGSLVTDTTYYLSVTAIDSNASESLEYSIETSGTPTEVPAAPEADTTAPTVLNVLAKDKNHVLVGFSEEVKLPELLAEAAFTITEQINPLNTLEVISAQKYADDPENKTVILETADQTKNVNYIVTASVAITDLAGNPIVSGSTDSGLFLGSDQGTTPPEEASPPAEEPAEAPVAELISEPAGETAEAVDVIPPEDITDLVLDFKEQLEKFVIIMNWTGSLNKAKDLIDQILYMSMDRGMTYDAGNSLGAVTTTHQVPNLEGGKEYTFKITTKDASGNESVGVIKSIRLPQTGFGAGMLVLASAGAAYQALKRRKTKKEIF
ncbi:fibronectin type III domain-containing protein [Patescibacteria group bacterium]|nr:fibronectin type III domain-containing protein [Patescibacteria group bacterium]MBU1015740.1 fibronectin type III domain-containing protein [Patescibacteria group bacterium]MBU1685502.1 fibronectin type III domain-containing protein [Patescibacteria group bacterium]MBU1938712.1 fibronectin type III domain-containing protein [Patescibacteria group bacterium]